MTPSARTGPFGSSLLAMMAASLTLSGCHKSEAVKDEATLAGVDDDRFVMAGEDYLHDMDGAAKLTAAEIQGRNMWVMWSGGNDRFWDQMNHSTFGTFDLLKIVAPPPDSPLRRPTRWQWLGAVNEPCFRVANEPDAARFGLWLDQRDPACPTDPFADEAKYPGVKLGARGMKYADGSSLPVGSYYGWPSGVVGLRLFPNPAFDEKAKANWNPVRFYSDPKYYNDPKLVRPYRVGMSCGFCHVGPSPTNPPKDPANPSWANLSSIVGAQYLWADRLFFWKPREDNFVYQLVHTYRPGTLDTSLVSTDNINNPRTENAVYELGTRLRIGKKIGQETLAGGGKDNRQFNDFLPNGWLTEFFKAPDQVWTPHVLKDGADSVGGLGALNRVYLNIGLYSEEWLRHFNPVVGGKPVTPIRIADARVKSAYWRATEKGTPNIALFFLKAATPHHLADAPDGKDELGKLTPQLAAQGADIFARTCARCHSSKQPDRVPADVKYATGKDYLASFRGWWRWTQSEDYKAQMRAIVRRPDFLTDNYLSTDARVPVTLLRTNLCSPLATNALEGNIWDNFSSRSYKELTPVGTVAYSDPFTGEPRSYVMPGGGRGYTRVPSLISLWSTAPYLLNNTVGPFSTDPSVAQRLTNYRASIAQMLWPERRTKDIELGAKGVGLIDRTTTRSGLFIPATYVEQIKPSLGQDGLDLIGKLADRDGNIRIGAIPTGVPVNLLAGLQPLAESKDPAKIAAHYHDLLQALIRLKAIEARLALGGGKGGNDAALRAAYAPLRAPLMRLSKCPDFVVNRGHYFGTAQFNQGVTADERSWGSETPLTDQEKNALIAFLMTF